MRVSIYSDTLRIIQDHPWVGTGLGTLAVVLAQRFALWDTTRKFFDQYELLLTPTLPIPPFAVWRSAPEEIAEIDGALPPFPEWLPFTYPWNLTGQPAATVPWGFTRDGLPVGLQIVGRRFGDVTVLRAAAAFEQAHPWADKWPSL